MSARAPPAPATRWDARVAADTLLYGTAPSAFLVDALGRRDAPPLDALDLACGEGRNAAFLSVRGYRTASFER